jgi:hypothetical protein
MSRVLGIVYPAIATHLIQQAGFTREIDKTSTVTFDNGSSCCSITDRSGKRTFKTRVFSCVEELEMADGCLLQRNITVRFSAMTSSVRVTPGPDPLLFGLQYLSFRYAA